eukprot:Nitzschia sp. Nitz4//scaffold195_size40117//18863//26201//NITZ4_007577-RA/size40117-processed-gene-0.15-mRNA-1//1//CDS//3329540368//2092//frame0
MSWAAANARKRKHSSSGDNAGGVPFSPTREKKRSTETVEAALARLSKAYTSAVECIAALSKTNALMKDPPTGNQEESLAMIRKVAKAARSTLEHAILADPLIVPLVPQLRETMLGLAGGDSNQWAFVTDKRPTPPVLSSGAHRSTVRELAYLALVNYADLLQTCSLSLPSPQSTATTTVPVIDRGVIKKLKFCQEVDCWGSESQEVIQRLTVTALCDASALDGTDPTMWLKLAVASRGLEKIDQTSTNSMVQSRYRWLQRYALERGTQARPSHLPPNRALQRALTELLAASDLPEYISARETEKKTIKLVLDLPRYSWSVLGRMLIKACREGNDFHIDRHRHMVTSSLDDSRVSFGSPAIDLCISPMLALPTNVLGMICSFLENKSIWRFEATCRALSASILSARALMEEGRNTKPVNDTSIANNATTDAANKEELTGDPATTTITTTKNDENPTKVRKDSVGDDNKLPKEFQRSSKRLRSQQISSGKKSERSSRRQSFEYCFLASVDNTTAEEHSKQLRALEVVAEARHLFPPKSSSDAVTKSVPKLEGSAALESRLVEAEERIGDASLTSFAECWSGQNSGPADLLSKYLLHVAVNVADVFASDPGGAVVLTSCILSCFEVIATRTGFHRQVVQTFYEPPKTTGDVQKSLELLAVDVVHAELLLKQCDRYTPTHIEFDDDSNIVTLLLPLVVEAARELQETLDGMNDGDKQHLDSQFLSLKIRTHWLVAGYFLWRSRVSKSVWEAREAEEEAIFEVLDSRKPQVIKTPHLVSPGRTEPYWKEISALTLTKYRDEVQAASVVSHVRQKFQMIVTALDRSRKEGDESSDIPTDDVKALSEIGAILLKRYNADDNENDSKYPELIDDFLESYGDNLEHSLEERKDMILPLGHSIDIDFLVQFPSPSVLTILVLCWKTSKMSNYQLCELLSKLVLATRKLHSSLVSRMQQLKRTGPRNTDDDFDDSDVSVDSEDQSEDRNLSTKSPDERKAVQCGSLMAFLLHRIHYLFENQLEDADKIEFGKSSDFHQTLKVAIKFSSEWFHSSGDLIDPTDDTDQLVVCAVKALVEGLQTYVPADCCQSVEKIVFKAYMQSLISQRNALKGLLKNHGDRSTRISKQKLCLHRTEYLGLLAVETATLLSQYLGSVDNLTFSPSPLLRVEAGSNGITKPEWIIFVEAVLWLWKFASQNFETSNTQPAVAVCSSFDRPIVRALRLPVATLVVGLCGTSLSPGKSLLTDSDVPLSLSEFLDSDASANSWSSEEEKEENDRSDKLKISLRMICHAAQTMQLVIDHIDDKTVNLYPPHCEHIGKYGPIFPMIVTRVANLFADTLLRNFWETEQEKEGALWAEKYPFRTQTVGEKIDGILHKSYRWQYGFALVSEKNHIQSSGTDLASSVAPVADLLTVGYQLEGIAAAGQLYRCISRAYAGGRRTPPKAALELVSSTLPRLEADESSEALRRFLFSPKTPDLELDQIENLFEKGDGWDTPFETIRRHISELSTKGETATDRSPMDDEVLRIRKGILAELAGGSLPSASPELNKKSSDSSEDDRALTSKAEEAISRKIEAILDDLCLGGMDDVEGWYRAAQCANMKAELVADRLGLSKGFSRNTKFAVPVPKPPPVGLFPLAELESAEEEQDIKLQANWIPHVGEDLSIYTRFCWSSIASLKECSEVVSKTVKKTTQEGNKETRALVKYMASLQRKGDILGWQETWGGLFVCALRKLSVRMTCLAMFVLQNRGIKSMEDRTLFSELSESVGIIMYSGIMASQEYGFPIRVIGNKRKRHLARTAKICFDFASQVTKQVNDAGVPDEEAPATWDLEFMVGKCEEKIAGTYALESFPDDNNVSKQLRLYEKHMAQAMKRYTLAYSQAKDIEEEGGPIVEKSGGSAHGSTEVLYRLLATRLKCLISAVSMGETHLAQAEDEALRLTEEHWFKAPENVDTLKDEHVRDRVWNVLSDIVAGFAQCRLNHNYFHRSVFRHAQALMWSPVLYDPASSEGSLGSVPATRAFQIRGLNNSTPAAQSAAIALNVLFDKRRTQLCAVWVTTTTASSPFQLLNNATRKYDSLRGKYISAYIETLRLCKRRGEVETFLKWIVSSGRDLPGYYQASALTNGSQPTKGHMSDCLVLLDQNSLQERGFLTTIKRQANAALSDILRNELEETLDKTAPELVKKVAEYYLKLAYAGYLRLNCSKEILAKTHAWRYGSTSLPEVDALCQAYLARATSVPGTESQALERMDVNEWSGQSRKSAILDAALSKCKELFPTLTGAFFSKKANAKSKKKNETGDNEANEGKTKDGGNNGAPSETTFEVAVPAELSAGESFFTTVKVGNATKKLKLTVPASNPSTLRFSLPTETPKQPTPTEEEKDEPPEME